MYTYGQTLGLAIGNTLTATPTAAGVRWIITMYTSGGGGSPYPTSIIDTQGNIWTSVLGTIGGASVYFSVTGGFFVSQYYADIAAGTSNTVTFTLHGGTPGTCFLFGGEYAGITGSPLTTMHTEQSSPGTGAGAVTTAASGGVGSLVVSTVPAAVVCFGLFPADVNVLWTAGSESTGRFISTAFWALEDLRATSGGSSYTNTFTIATNEDTACLMSAWAEAGGGGGAPIEGIALGNVSPGIGGPC